MTVEVVALDALPGAGGVVWSAAPEGVHVNLVVLAAGDGIGEHRNDALDVLLVALAGAATLTVDGDAVELAAGHAALVPRGALRAVAAGPAGVRYLTVHAERPPLAVRPRSAGDV